VRSFAVLVLLVSFNAFPAQHHQSESFVLAPGYGDLEFVLPGPGTYRLPVLGTAEDALVVNSLDQELSLHSLMASRFTLLSFIYTNCSDVNGCPVATYVMGRIQDRLKGDDALKETVRLVSFSFDPENDTAEVLQQYASNFRNPGSDWHFVTSRIPEELKKILSDYDQFVILDIDENGKLLGSISHMLRVYLIDHNFKIRNIYSVSFLHPDTVINDIKTIMLDRAHNYLKTQKQDQ